MRIESISLATVGVHDDAALSLPTSGAVVVTGPNGAGKSSYVEAVALALWGESLRGAPLWREGQAGEVEVTVEVGGRKLHVARKRTKAGAKSLTFSIDGAPPVKYETPTKAQEALEQLVGTFDSWRRTAVLSSADSAHFSLATDSERKRLLERLLGIDRLDTAAAAAREDQRKAQARRDLAQRSVQAAQHSEDNGRSRVAEIAAALAATPAEPPAVAGAVDHRAAIEVAQEELADVRAQLGEHQREVAQAGAELAEALRKARVCASSACPTCEQPIPAALKATLTATAEAASARQAQVTAAARQRGADLEVAQRELLAEIERLRDAEAQARAERAAAAKMAGVRQALEAQLAKARDGFISAAADHQQARSHLADCEAELGVAAAVVEVLGFKGVRAHLLDKALRRIEVVANRHLRVLREGMSLALAATTEKKTGGTSDAISLRVVVRAGEAARPYGSLSGGERRRVDVAVLLALADVAGSVAGQAGGTLWLDEVFDALDGDGTAAVAQLVERLTTTRTAVIITHAAGLVQELRAAQRIELSGRAQ